jgi:uncharacterized membrane protein
MTSPAEGSPSGAGRRLLWAAFAISLAINVFFVGTLVWLRMESGPQPPGQRLQQIAKDLHLSDEQREAFRNFATAMRRNTMQLRESNQPLVQRVWEEIGKPNSDLELVNRLVDQATENRHAYQKTMTAEVTRFLATLTPDQRSEFVTVAKNPHDQRAWLLRRLIIP